MELIGGKLDKSGSSELPGTMRASQGESGSPNTDGLVIAEINMRASHRDSGSHTTADPGLLGSFISDNGAVSEELQELARELMVEKKRALRLANDRLDKMQARISLLRSNGKTTIAEEDILAQLIINQRLAAEAYSVGEEACALVDVEPFDEIELLPYINLGNALAHSPDSAEETAATVAPSTFEQRAGRKELVDQAAPTSVMVRHSAPRQSIETRASFIDQEEFERRFEAMITACTLSDESAKMMERARTEREQVIVAARDDDALRNIGRLSAVVRLPQLTIPPGAVTDPKKYVLNIRSILLASKRSFLLGLVPQQLRHIVDMIVTNFDGDSRSLGNLAAARRIAAAYAPGADISVFPQVLLAAYGIVVDENKAMFAALASQTNIPVPVETILINVARLSVGIGIVESYIARLSVYEERELSKDQLLALEEAIQTHDISIQRGAQFGLEQWVGDFDMLLAQLAAAGMPSSLRHRQIALLERAFASSIFGKKVSEIRSIMQTTAYDGEIDATTFIGQVRRAAIVYDISHTKVVRANAALTGAAAEDDA